MFNFDHGIKQSGVCNMTEAAPRFVQAFRKSWIKWVVALALVPWTSASAVNLPAGYTKMGTWTPTLTGGAFGPYGGSTALAYGWGWKLSAWQTTPNDANGATCSIPGLPYVTIDGWSGFQIQSGVIIVLTGNLNATTITATPTGNTNVITDTYTAIWDDKGAITTNWLTPGSSSLCAAIKRPISGNFYVLDGGTTSMNVEYGVYVSPTAVAGPLPATTLQLHKTSGVNSRQLLSFTGLVVAQTECTLNTAPLVPFGDVTPSDVSSGIQVQSSLNVNCTNETGATADITYSVTPKSQAGDEYTLPMISTVGGGVAGDIRGFLGANATTDAGCTTKGSSLKMDSTKAALRSISANANWSDPLVWVLCPRATAEPGPATAAATIDVNW
ncbi:fimbrial protein [Serratia fonticola]|uniref:fimbrial protein n=1 Tax=Serratia fonticola TaxID=47917 RepID=UPI0021ADDCE1|nr:fimbrial protein [Serratia fonticola]